MILVMAYELKLKTDLRAGDIQFLQNHLTFNGCTALKDRPEALLERYVD